MTLSKEMIIHFDPLTASMTLLMALGLIWLGWKQIGALRTQLLSQLQTSQAQLKTVIERSQAALMPQMDARFDSREMEESGAQERQLLLRARNECQKLAGSTYEHALRSCYHRYVQELRASGDPNYDVLMRRCYFFETLGYFCEKGYLSYEDVAELYGMPILRTYLLLEHHIEDRQKTEGAKVFEFFVKLADKAQSKYPGYEVRNSL